MAAEFELTDEMRSVVGVLGEPWRVEVTTTSVRAFARGVGYTDRVYYDVETAKAAGYENLPAPPTYLGTAVFDPTLCEPTFGAPRDSGPVLRTGLANLLDGGTETTYERTIVAGDVLESQGGIVELEVKESKGLGKMLVVTSETTFTDVRDGSVVARQRAQVIWY